MFRRTRRRSLGRRSCLSERCRNGVGSSGLVRQLHGHIRGGRMLRATVEARYMAPRVSQLEVPLMGGPHYWQRRGQRGELGQPIPRFPQIVHWVGRLRVDLEQGLVRRIGAMGKAGRCPRIAERLCKVRRQRASRDGRALRTRGSGRCREHALSLGCTTRAGKRCGPLMQGHCAP